MPRPLLAVLLLAAFLNPAGSFADVEEPIDGEVAQGSHDNMVEVVVSNPTEETAAGNVTFEVTSAPSWIEVTATEADSEGELAAGAGRTFTVVFDVADDAEVGSIDDLFVSFTTTGALIDQPSARIRLRVGPREDEEEPAACPIDHEHAIPDWSGAEKHYVYVFRHHASEAVERVLIYSGPVEATFYVAGGEPFGPFSILGDAQTKAEEYCPDEPDEEAGPGRPPVLRLAKIVSSFGDEVTGGSVVNSGSDSMSTYEELLSGKLGGVPRTIVAGTGISFDGSALRSVRYADGSLCFPGEQEPDSRVVSVGLNAGVRAEAHGTVGMHNYCGGNIIRSASWNTGSRSYSGVNVFSDSASVSITLTPTETVVDEDDPNVVDYRYRASASSPNVLAEGEDLELVLIRQRYPTDANGFVVGEVPTGSGFSVSLTVPSISDANGIGVTLVYEPMATGEQPLDPPPYEHPEPFPPTPATGGTTEDEDLVTDDGTGTGGTTQDEDPATDGEVPTGSGGGSDPADNRVDPAALDPNSSDTSALIREWLGVAEPPENATLGAEFHYNEWGVKLGRTPGGIISGTPGRPDDVGARTSPEYVWGLRDRLDSVDHCTVGEFVIARLESASIAGCTGRYPRTVAVPRVRGLAVGQAVDEIGRSGLEARPTFVGPPPSRDLANRVADQRPSSTERLVSGAVVEIEIYGEFEESLVVMPDLVGKSETLAVAWLEDLGLRPSVRRAGPAPAAESAGTVAAQSRPPDAELRSGEEVMLFVFGTPAPARVATPVPAVTPGPAITQATCDRSWPGTVLTRDPATGADNCLCPSGTAWSKVRNTCLSLGGTPPVRAADCRHMPGTIRNPATGACTCPVGAWDPAQGRCFDTSAADREREIADVSKGASCERLYSDIILFRRTPAYREMAARAEREARELGCDEGRIAEATGTGGGGSGDDTPITPVTGPVETKDEGEARVSSRNVNICVIDVNSVLDDHYDLVINGRFVGEVANPEGGTICYGVMLRGGANELLLKLVATRGKSTYLKISINNDEYSTTFGGSTNHAWSVVAP